MTRTSGFISAEASHPNRRAKQIVEICRISDWIYQALRFRQIAVSNNRADGSGECSIAVVAFA